jgi:hypothetical protein
MTALALHLPQRQGLSRWAVAAVTVLVAHAALVAAIVLWYARKPVEPDTVPAIAVTLLPVEATSPEIQNQDIAVGPAMQEAEEAPKELPEEKPIEKVDQPPLPPQQAEIRCRKSRRIKSRPRSPRFNHLHRRRERHRRQSASDNSRRPAPMPITPWCSGTCNASSTIRHRRAGHRVPRWCDLD